VDSCKYSAKNIQNFTSIKEVGAGSYQPRGTISKISKSQNTSANIIFIFDKSKFSINNVLFLTLWKVSKWLAVRCFLSCD